VLLIQALAQLGRQVEAQQELEAAGSEWLAPPTGPYAFNQVASKPKMLELLDLVGGLATLRREVAAAPEPEVYLPDIEML
jgi:hypothetical protein